MFGNIWLSTLLSVVAIFSASVAYKSYQDIQEVKQLRENYKIVSDIKTLLAKQYNQSPSEITRDDIIALLPQGGSWEKILLLNRRNDSNILNDALVNEDGEMVLNENERLRLLALRANLKLGNTTEQIGTDLVFNIGSEEENNTYDDKELKRRIDITVELLDINLLSLTTQVQFDTFIHNNTPHNILYQNFKTIPSENLTDAQLEERQEDYYAQRILEELLQSRNRRDIKIYNAIKGFYE